MNYVRLQQYSGVSIVASCILHEIYSLLGEFAIGGTELTLNARLGTEVTCDYSSCYQENTNVAV